LATAIKPEVASLPLTLKHFIIFCSYIFQDMKVLACACVHERMAVTELLFLFRTRQDLRSMYYAKLSLITLCCLFEDDTVNEMCHSDQLLCVIPYYQVLPLPARTRTHARSPGLRLTLYPYTAAKESHTRVAQGTASAGHHFGCAPPLHASEPEEEASF
jgi:hypothetical protein